MYESSTTTSVKRVFIAPGCIVCNLCEDTCPQVFDVQADSCVVRPNADRYFSTHASEIAQAAAECPVDVIRVVGINEPE